LAIPSKETHPRQRRPEINLILIRNIVKTMEWYDSVKPGKSFAQIAIQAALHRTAFGT
jgi:hypothetical protein